MALCLVWLGDKDSIQPAPNITEPYNQIEVLGKEIHGGGGPAETLENLRKSFLDYDIGIPGRLFTLCCSFLATPETRRCCALAMCYIPLNSHGTNSGSQSFPKSKNWSCSPTGPRKTASCLPFGGLSVEPNPPTFGTKSQPEGPTQQK